MYAKRKGEDCELRMGQVRALSGSSCTGLNEGREQGSVNGPGKEEVGEREKGLYLFFLHLR